MTTNDAHTTLQNVLDRYAVNGSLPMLSACEMEALQIAVNSLAVVTKAKHDLEEMITPGKSDYELGTIH